MNFVFWFCKFVFSNVIPTNYIIIVVQIKLIMESNLKKIITKKVYKGGAEKTREKKEFQLKVAAKSCRKISDIFSTNQPKQIKVDVFMNN